MAVANNLYPPIVDTYMPAFLIGSTNKQKNTCRVYFSISQYNNFSDIMNAQITVRYQNTNVNALSRSRYPSDVKIMDIKIDEDKISDDKYYIEILPGDLDGGQFELNQYYQVQIRFTRTNSDGRGPQSQPPIKGDGTQAISEWLSTNLQYFSEWSTICLVGGISVPTLDIRDFQPERYGQTTWSLSTVDIVGKINFSDEDEDETLKSYRLRLYSETEELIEDSGEIYTNPYIGFNEINYLFKYGFQDGEIYNMRIDYTTRNLYTDYEEYRFMVVLGNAGALDATLSAIQDNENGQIGINIKGNTTERFTGNITIRRTSSESNFSMWEDVKNLTVENQLLDIIWCDRTVKSGVWYRYAAQKRDSLGNRGPVVELKNPVMIVFDHIYLNAAGVQINIKYNPDVSSFKTVVSENKTDTIGSKYPFIKRNGNTFYREFPLSGTITYMMDQKEGLPEIGPDSTGNHIVHENKDIFEPITTKEDMYKDTLELYEDYDSRSTIHPPYSDVTWERDYREKIMDFLYKHNVKLFRSATEGNILVKLMNISFTPNKTLGRMIYNFSCTCEEIDECTVDNCNLYDIQPVGKINESLGYTQEFIGQFMEEINVNVLANMSDDIIKDMLQEHYQKLAEPGYIKTIEYLDHLKITFDSEPYLIKEGDNGPYPIDDVYEDNNSWDRLPANDSYLGYIIYIDGEPTVVNPEGVYELKGEGVRVHSLRVPKSCEITLDYHIVLSQTEDKSQLPKSTIYTRRIGQLWGKFDFDEGLFQKIWNKYYEKYPGNWIQRLNSLTNVKIEANPGTVVYVMESRDNGYNRHIIGDTCTLSFETDDTAITGLYFSGVHFEEATDQEKDRDNMPDNRYYDTGIVVNSLNEILRPIRGGVYTLNGTATTANELNEVMMDTNNEYYKTLIPSLYEGQYANELAERMAENKYIWYNEKWWVFTDTHDLLCPVEGLIDYYADVSKGYYAENA